MTKVIMQKRERSLKFLLSQKMGFQFIKVSLDENDKKDL